jgi:hypothetical protein
MMRAAVRFLVGDLGSTPAEPLGSGEVEVNLRTISNFRMWILWGANLQEGLLAPDTSSDRRPAG